MLQKRAGDLIIASLYVLITFSITWSIWIFVNNPAVEILGSCMPSIVGFTLIKLSKSTTYAGIGKRMVSFKLIQPFWYIVIFLSIPAITLLSYLTQMLLGGDIPSMDTIVQNISNPQNIFMLLILSFGAGLGEELGWRGLLLDTFQKYFGSLTSSIIIGVIWALWHIPLSLLNGVSILSPTFINYFLFVVLLSVLIAQVYGNNKRSLLAAMLLHGMVNATQYILFANTTIPIQMNIIKTVYLFLLVIGVLIINKKKATVFPQESAI